MTNAKNNVLVAFHDTHIYVRVSTRTDDEGQKLDHTDGPLIRAARTADTNAKGKIIDKRLCVIVSKNRNRVPALAAKIFGAAIQLQKYNCQLGVPEQEKPGNIVFCAADRTLKDLQRVARAIPRHIRGTSIEVTWPYLVVRYKTEEVDEIDVEPIASAELKIPLGQRNTMWNLKL